MKIALCDDEREQLAQTKTYLQEYFLLHPGMDAAVTAFSCGATLLEHLRTKGAFDLYLLDVIMPRENGIDLGLSIREFDQGGPIIYLTSSPDFAVDSYQARASAYLLKPLDKNRLFQTLDDIVEKWFRENRSFTTIKTKGGLRRLPVRAIVYGELVNRCVQYHLSDGSAVEGMSLRGPFQEAVKPLLEHRQFVLCATSFLVNLSFVEMIEPSGLRLTGGKILPLSRPLRAEVTGRWMDYCLKQ